MIIKIEQVQKQNIAITQQLIQNIEVLQMSSQELAEFVYNEAIENPVIDMDNLHISDLRNKIDWLRRNNQPPKNHNVNKDDDNPIAHQQENKATKKTLKTYLKLQLTGYKLSDKDRLISRYLIACVDSKGYLDEDLDYTADLLGVSKEEVSACIDRLRSFNPVGVCSKNLEDCLLMQLNKTEKHPLTEKIILNHLGSIAKGHYSKVAKELGVPLESVKKSIEIIKTLSPIPAAGFDSDYETFYSLPDASITVNEGEIEISLTSSYVPNLIVNDYYLDLFYNTSDESVKDYLDKKIKSADWLIKCIIQREKTLIECLNVICSIQKDYFLNHSNFLQPMSIRDVAEKMGVHSSTISRAIRGKFVQCSGGVVPIKSFFTHKASKELSATSSSDQVKNFIIEIIENEDSSTPLSDQNIASELESAGFNVSRRTVTKYREDLGIPSTLLRRKP